MRRSQANETSAQSSQGQLILLIVRVVIDTNQLVAVLVRPPELATLLMAWKSGRFTVVASQAIAKEYQLVLKYPSIFPLLSPELLRAFEQHLTYVIDWVKPEEEIQQTGPSCRYLADNGG